MFKAIAIATAAIAVVTIASVGQIAVSTPAAAQSYSSGYDDGEAPPPHRTSRRTPRMPAPGYEGFDGPFNYCTYKRLPNVRCTTNEDGESHCRTASWRLEQNCY